MQIRTALSVDPRKTAEQQVSRFWCGFRLAVFVQLRSFSVNIFFHYVLTFHIALMKTVPN